MEVQVKQRIVGASVLCALAVIFVPMLFDDSEPVSGRIEQTNIPQMPSQEFSSRIVPLDETAPPPVVVEPSASAIAPVEEVTSGPEESQAGTGSGNASTEQSGPRVGLTAWAVQLGSFSKEENARALESTLRKGGHSAFVEKLVTDADTVFRVRVGPELLRDDAQSLRDKLAKEVELEGIVVRYP